jgi:hypothetical protein
MQGRHIAAFLTNVVGRERECGMRDMESLESPFNIVVITVSSHGLVTVPGLCLSLVVKGSVTEIGTCMR